MPITYPIVGSFYRPPAKAILAAIPVGTPLELRAEPNNPVDPNAIAVWIKTKDIPESAHSELILAGADCGFRIGEEPAETAEMFLHCTLSEPEWHLGYIPAIEAKKPSAKALVDNNCIAPGNFILTLAGKPHFTLSKDWEL